MQSKIILAIIGTITIIILAAMVLYGPSAEGQCMTVEGFGIKIIKEDVRCNLKIENIDQNLQNRAIEYNNNIIDKSSRETINTVHPAPVPSSFEKSIIEKKRINDVGMIINVQSELSSLPPLVGKWYIGGFSKTIGQYGGIIEFSENNQFVLQLSQLEKMANPQYGSYQYNGAQSELTLAFNDGTTQVFKISNITTNAFTLSDSYGTLSLIKAQ